MMKKKISTVEHSSQMLAGDTELSCHMSVVRPYDYHVTFNWPMCVMSVTSMIPICMAICLVSYCCTLRPQEKRAEPAKPQVKSEGLFEDEDDLFSSSTSAAPPPTAESKPQ